MPASLDCEGTSKKDSTTLLCSPLDTTGQNSLSVPRDLVLYCLHLLHLRCSCKEIFHPSKVLRSKSYFSHLGRLVLTFESFRLANGLRLPILLRRWTVAMQKPKYSGQMDTLDSEQVLSL